MYIYNANVITMAEKNYENGFILIENDKIKAVGNMSQLKDFSPSDSDIDAKGRTAYPGFIDAHTRISVRGRTGLRSRATTETRIQTPLPRTFVQ